MADIVQEMERAVQHDRSDVVRATDPKVAALLNQAGITNLKTPGGQPITATIGYMTDRASVAAATAGRPMDPQFESLRQAVMHRHEATGIEPATILNYLPIPLVVNSPMLDLKIRIAPAPSSLLNSDEFSFHTWDQPAIEVMERGEQIKQPWDYMPVQIAKAFVDEYREFGGVVLLRGLPTHENLSRPEVVKAIREAQEKMHGWMVSKVEEANGEWNLPNHGGARNIVELHRACALRLKDLGLIDTLPDWIVNARPINEVSPKCPICKSTPNPGAVRCACTYVLDPAAAFLNNDITEEDASLERLTRAAVIDLGISAYVAETSDERPGRLERGDAKPISKAQQRALQAQADPQPTGGDSAASVKSPV